MKSKKIVRMLLLSLFIVIGCNAISYGHTSDEMRAVWISTVYNLDYPKVQNDPIGQQLEFIQILDQLQSIGINTVVVQVRPKADALYRSEINPWSDVLTGTQGKDPGYDPLSFMIEETHKRGMAFHAWLNPYRVTTSGTDVAVLAPNHPARLNPSWVMSYNNALYYNPESEGVKQHIVDTVVEIIENYNVDGIHFDDYFYPANYPLPPGESKDGYEANKRREHVNDMIREVGKAVDSIKPEVTFGVSPGGIWKNTLSDFTGSNTQGSESYYKVYADTRTWIQNEWIDYVVPQIYWETGHTLADYETLVKWWANEVRGTDVTLYIGQGIYKDVVAKEISTQLQINEGYQEVRGSFFFSLRDLLNNRANCQTALKAYYSLKPELPEKPNKPEYSLESCIGKTVTVTTKTLNVREGGRTDRPIIGTLKQDDQVQVLSLLNGWFKIKFNGEQRGWIHSDYVTMNLDTSKPEKEGIVTATSLNVRKGQGTQFEKIGALPKGSTVHILEESDKWYRVSNGQFEGWVSVDYIHVKK